MDIYELPNGKVVTTGSFSVAEWDEYLESLPKSKREAAVAPPGSVTPIPEADASADDGSEEPKAAPAKTPAKSSASNTAARKTAAKGKS
jgi:hypothetical protein